MIPAARTNATPDARLPQSRSGSDGTPRDDGFDSAMADVAQNGSDAASTKAVAAASAPVQPGAGQGMAALLAKLANGAPLASADGQGAAGVEGDASTGDASTTAKSDKASDDAAAATPAVTDPLAAMVALLPGIAAAPMMAAAAATAKATSDSAKLSSALGKASLATAVDTSKDQGVTTSGDGATTAERVLDFTVVASSTHLAPAAPPVVPQPAGASTPEAAKSATAVSTGDTTAPSVSATTETSAQDVAPIAAVTSRTEPGASLPDGTLQSIATAVTSLAADVASASSDAAPSAAATVTDPTPAWTSPARSLTLQLNPDNLGSVTVRLHLTANGLDVNVAVDDRKTLASISHARDELAAAIGDNGYRVDSLVIRGSDASSTSTAGSHDSARSQSEAGAGQGFSGGGSGGSGGDASSSRQRPPPSSAGARDPSRDRGGDGVFV